MKFKRWNKFSVGEICEVIDCQHKTAKTLDYETEYRMLRTPNIRNGRLIDIESTRSVSENVYKEWSRRAYLEEEDIILTREAPMGEVAILKESKYKFFLGQRLLQLKANRELVTPNFLFYSLQTPDLRNQIMINEGTGSVVSNLRIPHLKKMDIYIPSIEEQNKITVLLEKIDDKIKVNQQVILSMEKVMTLLFKHWFIDFEFPNEQGQSYRSSGGKMVESELGLIPEKWSIQSILDIAEVMSGGTPRTTIEEYWNGDIPFFTPKDSRTSFYSIKTEKYITEDGLMKCASSLYPKNTIFITARGTVGKLSLAGKPMAMNQSCYALKHKLNYQFYLYLQLKNLMRQIIQSSNGAVFSAINVRDFNYYNLPYPNQMILDSFENRVAPLFIEIHTLLEQNERLNELRDTLLPKLLSGEIELPIKETMEN